MVHALGAYHSDSAGAYGCARALHLGESTDSFVAYCLKVRFSLIHAHTRILSNDPSFLACTTTAGRAHYAHFRV